MYEFDVRLGERFTALQGSINGLHDRMNIHDSAHNTAAGGVVVDNLSEVQNKSAKFVVPALTVLVSIGTAIGVVIKTIIVG